MVSVKIVIVICDMCIVMWNFTIRNGKIVQQAEGELDNPSSIVTTHYDTNIVLPTFIINTNIFVFN
jgi:hypothetical protein